MSDEGGFVAKEEDKSKAKETMVPDGEEQITSDQGYDLDRDGDRLVPIIQSLKQLGCRVSLFMDPDPEAMAQAAEVGAERIELYTEAYARAHERGDFVEVLARYA